MWHNQTRLRKVDWLLLFQRFLFLSHENSIFLIKLLTKPRDDFARLFSATCNCRTPWKKNFFFINYAFFLLAKNQFRSLISFSSFFVSSRFSKKNVLWAQQEFENDPKVKWISSEFWLEKLLLILKLDVLCLWTLKKCSSELKAKHRSIISVSRCALSGVDRTEAISRRQWRHYGSSSSGRLCNDQQEIVTNKFLMFSLKKRKIMLNDLEKSENIDCGNWLIVHSSKCVLA